MAKRKKKSWLERNQMPVMGVIILIQFGLILAMTLMPCTVTIRPVEMPKVTPQIKPPYQWGQRA